MIGYLLFITLAFGFILMQFGRANLNFDNIMKIMQVFNLNTGATLVSTEIDFNIPRGFIVKIHYASIQLNNIGEDIEGISVDKIIRPTAALVKDPDDITSVAFTSNQVDHDILMTLNSEILIVAGTAGDVTALAMKLFVEKNFAAEGLDVFTARNMRLNSDVFGTDAADATESSIEVIIHYTLEKITSDLIIDLLSIL